MGLEISGPSSAALSATFASAERLGTTVTQRQQEDNIRRGKLGKVGTRGKAVISFRFDHQVDDFLAKVQPLMWARRLPYSIGIVTGSVGNPAATYEPTTATWADIRTDIYDKGGELWAHSRTHSDPTGAATYYDEIVGSKLDIEAEGMSCMGFQQPGGPSTYGNLHTTPDAMNTAEGRIIRDYFALYESQLADTSFRFLPTEGCRGLNHLTLDTMTLAQAKGYIDQAAGLPAGLQLMLHAAILDDPGFMSTATLTAILDYVVELRDAGKIEVLTGSGLAFADPSVDYRPSLIPNGRFEGLTTATPPAAWSAFSGDAWRIKHDGDIEGVANYLSLPAGRATASALWRDRVDWMGAYGFTYEVRAWVRVNTTATNYMVNLTATTPGVNHNMTPALWATPAAVGKWEFVRVPFTMPAEAGENLLASFGGDTGGEIDWADVQIVAV